MNRNDRLATLFEQYQRVHGGMPAGTAPVIRWALENGLIDLPKFDPVKILADSMSRALRDMYFTDPETGKRARKYHSVTIGRHGVQESLWANIDAPREHMEMSFQQRRRGIVHDCIHLKTDVDVYNSRNKGQLPLPLVLDFTEDVAEHEAANDADNADDVDDAA